MTTNTPIEIYREGYDARRTHPYRAEIGHQCLKTFEPLRECLGTKTLAINLDQSDCDTREWRANCPGIWRRYFIEQTYRQQTNILMYKQDTLDAYAQAKNSQKATW